MFKPVKTTDNKRNRGKLFEIVYDYSNICKKINNFKREVL